MIRKAVLKIAAILIVTYPFQAIAEGLKGGALPRTQDGASSTSSSTDLADSHVTSAIQTSIQTSDLSEGAGSAREMQARYAHAKWTYPLAAASGAYYPARAKGEDIFGVATIKCQVTRNGHLDKCAVLSEAPKGYDLGVAAATLFENYCHVDPQTIGGGIKPGDYAFFNYKWQPS